MTTFFFRSADGVLKYFGSDSLSPVYELLNGIPLNTGVHHGSHTLYDNKVLKKLNDIPDNLSDGDTYTKVLELINDIRAAMIANPTTYINQLIF